MPTWLQEVFLGYGDPAGATNLPNTPQMVDYRDTFLHWQHVLESFPDTVSFAWRNNKSVS
jgi:intron-binding protein aquarius